MRSKWYYVYILTNKLKTVLYTGVTNDLKQRIIEHWENRGKNNSFTSRYHVYNLLYYECHQYINNAIARETEIKGWRREKNIKLINELNPELKFLNEKFFGEWPPKHITSRLKSANQIPPSSE